MIGLSTEQQDACMTTRAQESKQIISLAFAALHTVDFAWMFVCIHSVTQIYKGCNWRRLNPSTGTLAIWCTTASSLSSSSVPSACACDGMLRLYKAPRNSGLASSAASLASCCLTAGLIPTAVSFSCFSNHWADVDRSVDAQVRRACRA